MPTELFRKIRRKINTLGKYPLRTLLKYIRLVESRMVGYKIPQLDHNYEELLRVKKGDVVVDAGAHIGLFAHTVAKRAKIVIAIECEPKNLEQLRRNLRHFKNAIVVEKALWNCRARLPLHLGHSSDHSLIQDVEIEGSKPSANREITVEADTLDRILCDLKICKVDFVKMDIEGAEIEALQGAIETLKGVSKIVVAAYHERDGAKTIHQVIKKLANSGFKVYRTAYSTAYDLAYGLKT